MAAADDLTALFLESYRLRLLRGIEDRLAHDGLRLVAGVDEVGRGCLAGPVVAAAVLFDARDLTLVPGVDDSKKVPEERRARLAELVERCALATAWCAVPAETIERINIRQATLLAMRRVVSELEPQPDAVIVDAENPELDLPTLSIHRGDAWSYAVACASLVAKVHRDRLMDRWHSRFPEYDFRSNKGYGAPQHRRALEEIGPSPIHRLTFRSVVPRLAADGGAHGTARAGGV